MRKWCRLELDASIVALDPGRAGGERANERAGAMAGGLEPASA